MPPKVKQDSPATVLCKQNFKVITSDPQLQVSCLQCSATYTLTKGWSQNTNMKNHLASKHKITLDTTASAASDASATTSPGTAKACPSKAAAKNTTTVASVVKPALSPSPKYPNVFPEFMAGNVTIKSAAVLDASPEEGGKYSIRLVKVCEEVKALRKLSGLPPSIKSGGGALSGKEEVEAQTALGKEQLLQQWLPSKLEFEYLQVVTEEFKGNKKSATGYYRKWGTLNLRSDRSGEERSAAAPISNILPHLHRTSFIRTAATNRFTALFHEMTKNSFSKHKRSDFKKPTDSTKFSVVDYEHPWIAILAVLWEKGTLQGKEQDEINKILQDILFSPSGEINDYDALVDAALKKMLDDEEKNGASLLTSVKKKQPMFKIPRLIARSPDRVLGPDFATTGIPHVFSYHVHKNIGILLSSLAQGMARRLAHEMQRRSQEGKGGAVEDEEEEEREEEFLDVHLVIALAPLVADLPRDLLIEKKNKKAQAVDCGKQPLMGRAATSENPDLVRYSFPATMIREMCKLNTQSAFMGNAAQGSETSPAEEAALTFYRVTASYEIGTSSHTLVESAKSIWKLYRSRKTYNKSKGRGTKDTHVPPVELLWAVINSMSSNERYISFFSNKTGHAAFLGDLKDFILEASNIELTGTVESSLTEERLKDGEPPGKGVTTAATANGKADDEASETTCSLVRPRLVIFERPRAFLNACIYLLADVVKNSTYYGRNDKTGPFINNHQDYDCLLQVLLFLTDSHLRATTDLQKLTEEEEADNEQTDASTKHGRGGGKISEVLLRNRTYGDWEITSSCLRFWLYFAGTSRLCSNTTQIKIFEPLMSSLELILKAALPLAAAEQWTPSEQRKRAWDERNDYSYSHYSGSRVLGAEWEEFPFYQGIVHQVTEIAAFVTGRTNGRITGGAFGWVGGLNNSSHPSLTTIGRRLWLSSLPVLLVQVLESSSSSAERRTASTTSSTTAGGDTCSAPPTTVTSTFLMTTNPTLTSTILIRLAAFLRNPEEYLTPTGSGGGDGNAFSEQEGTTAKIRAQSQLVLNKAVPILTRMMLEHKKVCSEQEVRAKVIKNVNPSRGGWLAPSRNSYTCSLCQSMCTFLISATALFQNVSDAPIASLVETTKKFFFPDEEIGKVFGERFNAACQTHLNSEFFRNFPSLKPPAVPAPQATPTTAFGLHSKPNLGSFRPTPTTTTLPSFGKIPPTTTTSTFGRHGGVNSTTVPIRPFSYSSAQVQTPGPVPNDSGETSSSSSSSSG